LFIDNCLFEKTFVSAMKKIKLGILGTGHLGNIHIKLSLELSDSFEVIGFYDPDPENDLWIEGVREYGSTD